MLRPQDTATRERKSLDAIGHFRLDAEGAGRAAGWASGPLPEPRPVPVPASGCTTFSRETIDALSRDVHAQAIRELEPSRPVGFVNVMLAPHKR